MLENKILDNLIMPAKTTKKGKMPVIEYPKKMLKRGEATKKDKLLEGYAQIATYQGSKSETVRRPYYDIKDIPEEYIIEVSYDEATEGGKRKDLLAPNYGVMRKDGKLIYFKNPFGFYGEHQLAKAKPVQLVKAETVGAEEQPVAEIKEKYESPKMKITKSKTKGALAVIKKVKGKDPINEVNGGAPENVKEAHEDLNDGKQPIYKPPKTYTIPEALVPRDVLSAAKEARGMPAVTSTAGSGYPNPNLQSDYPDIPASRPPTYPVYTYPVHRTHPSDASYTYQIHRAPPSGESVMGTSSSMGGPPSSIGGPPSSAYTGPIYNPAGFTPAGEIRAEQIGPVSNANPYDDVPLVYGQTTEQAIVTQLRLLKQNNQLQLAQLRATQNPAVERYLDIPFREWLQYANKRSAEVLAYQVDKANRLKLIEDLAILNQAKTRNYIFNDYYFKPFA